MDINTKNYFSLFSLEPACELDESSLRQRYRELQARFHPDKFAGKDERQRRMALQNTSLLNEAYETLRSPVRRCAYLLDLKGLDVSHRTHSDGAFLLRQLELREQLEAVADDDDLDALDAMKAEVNTAFREELANFAGHYQADQLEPAADSHGRLQFLGKLLTEIDTVEEKLLDY